jgi:hypothetical protein
VKKLIVLVFFLILISFAKRVEADCICYGILWQGEFVYATSECLEDIDPCPNAAVSGESNWHWQSIPQGEWPAGLTDLVCIQHVCNECGNIIYDCDDIRPSMRRRYFDTAEGC